MPKTQHSSRLTRAALGITAMLVMAVLSMLPGSWEVNGAPLQVTPRGTAPLPPQPSPVPTTSASITPTPGIGQTPGPVQVVTPVAPTVAPTVEPTAVPSGNPSPEVVRPSPTTSAAPITPTTSVNTPVVQVPTLQPATDLARPVPTSTVFSITPGQSGPLVSEDGVITITLPVDFSRTPVRLMYSLTTLTPEQRQAAYKQGLLSTNLAFSLGLDPTTDSLPVFALSAHFLPQQVAEIEPGSLALYHFDQQQAAWTPLKQCSTLSAQQRIQCSAQQLGIFLLAGAAPPAEGPSLFPGWLIVALLGCTLAAVAVFMWRLQPWRGRRS